jgi:enoyl-CoA hydratase
MGYETLRVDLQDGIATVRLNRPERGNAINATMWQEIRQAFEWVDQMPQARVAVLQGEGRHFCTGIDLQMLMELAQQVQQGECSGRSREELRRVILDMQETLNSLERCRKPVLAAIHGVCMGGGLDLVCCADMR